MSLCSWSLRLAHDPNCFRPRFLAYRKASSGPCPIGREAEALVYHKSGPSRIFRSHQRIFPDSDRRLSQLPSEQKTINRSEADSPQEGTAVSLLESDLRKRIRGSVDSSSCWRLIFDYYSSEVL